MKFWAEVDDVAKDGRQVLIRYGHHDIREARATWNSSQGWVGSGNGELIPELLVTEWIDAPRNEQEHRYLFTPEAIDD
jgi:hypothetical protein